MVHTVDTDIILILVGGLYELRVIQSLVDAWVALGTGTDSAVSTPFVTTSVHNQELFQCFMHLLAAILHQPSEVRAKYQLGRTGRNMKSLHRFNMVHKI